MEGTAMYPLYAPAGIDAATAQRLAGRLQDRLTALVDMSLTLKHAHWNVVGPGFIGVHELLDDQVDMVRRLSDALAERIGTLGSIPNGLAGFIVEYRPESDYAIGRAVVAAHLGAIDKAYERLITGCRAAITDLGSADPVTTDLLIQQTRSLEHLQWLIRAHLENTSGYLPTTAEDSQLDAAVAAAVADPLQ